MIGFAFVPFPEYVQSLRFADVDVPQPVLCTDGTPGARMHRTRAPARHMVLSKQIFVHARTLSHHQIL